MSNPDDHHLLLSSIPDWNAWRRSKPHIKPDLSNISLAKERLVGADLHDANLKKTILQEADLSGANLEDADLQGAVLDHAILDSANLRRAILDSASFNGAQLTGADLREARLRDAVLQRAEGLSEEQLAGTDLQGATLPNEIQKEQILRFGDGLDRIEQASSKLQSLFFTLLAACIYCWLTMIATKDAQLLANDATSTLPMIGAKISIIDFYWTVPLFLLVFYIFFHLHLQRLWELLAALPVVFPDGTSLDERSHPRHVGGFIRARAFLLKQSSSPTDSLYGWLFVILSWANVPVTLLGFWWTLLPRQDLKGQIGAFIILNCTILSVAFSVISYKRAVATLQTKATSKMLRLRYRNNHNGSAITESPSVTPDWRQQVVNWSITVMTTVLLICLLTLDLLGLFHWGELSGRSAIAFFICGCLALLLGLPAYHHAVVTYTQTKKADKRRSGFKKIPGETTLPDLGIASLAIFLVWAGFWLIRESNPDAISKGMAWAMLILVTTTLLFGLSTVKRLFDAGWAALRTDRPQTVEDSETAKDDTVNMRLISAVAFGLVFMFLIKVTQAPECLTGGELENEAWKIQGRNPVDYVFCYPVAYVNYEDISIKASNWSPDKDGSSELVQGAPMKGSKFNHAQAAGTFFVNADLYGAWFDDALLDSANFSHAYLQDAKLRHAYLRWANFSEADLRQADLRGAVLLGANLEKASLNIFTNCHQGCLDSVKLEHANLRGATLSEARLEGADLYCAQLHDAKLGKVNLRGASLERATLARAYLREARFDAGKVTEMCKDRLVLCRKPNPFPTTELPGTDLRRADLTSAILIAAKLNEADLRGANLTGADLSGADLEGALLDWTNLSRTNLRTAVNLKPEQLRHTCIDQDTKLPSYIEERPQRAEWCDKPWLLPPSALGVSTHGGLAMSCTDESDALD